MQAVLDYGMYDAKSPSPGYLLQLSLPDEEEDKCFYDKEGILEDQGMSKSQSFTLVPRQAPSPEMIAFLRLMNIQGAILFLVVYACRMRAPLQVSATGFRNVSI